MHTPGREQILTITPNPNLGHVHMPRLSIHTAGRVYSHCGRYK